MPGSTDRFRSRQVGRHLIGVLEVATEVHVDATVAVMARAGEIGTAAVADVECDRPHSPAVQPLVAEGQEPSIGKVRGVGELNPRQGSNP